MSDESLCEPNASDENNSNLRRGIVSHISSDLKVYIQYSDQAENLEQLQTMLQKSLNQEALSDEYIPEEDDLLAARFSADNEWYRARVENIEENNQITVYFVDYGNREVITDLNRLKTLPPGTYVFLLFTYSRVLITKNLFSSLNGHKVECPKDYTLHLCTPLC